MKKNVPEVLEARTMVFVQICLAHRKAIKSIKREKLSAIPLRKWQIYRNVIIRLSNPKHPYNQNRHIAGFMVFFPLPNFNLVVRKLKKKTKYVGQ